MVDFNELIPELAEWNNGKGIDIDGWICGVGSFEHAIGYTRLFWPEFVEHEGCVFVAGFSVESYEGFLEQTKGDKRAVEAVMNHRHILTLFGDVDLDPTEEQIVYFGRRLREIWQAKLDRDFPERKIVVRFFEEGCEDLYDYQITFFQDEREAGG
jgi:hypothetical protein